MAATGPPRSPPRGRRPGRSASRAHRCVNGPARRRRERTTCGGGPARVHTTTAVPARGRFARPAAASRRPDDRSPPAGTCTCAVSRSGGSGSAFRLSEARRATSDHRLRLLDPAAAPGAVTTPSDRSPRRPGSPGRAGCAALGSLLLLVNSPPRRRLAARVTQAAPIIDRDELLPDDTHLLRQLDAAHRPRVHDDHGRHLVRHHKQRGRRPTSSRASTSTRTRSRVSRRRRALAAGVRRSDRARLAPTGAERQRRARLLHPHHR